MRVYEFNYCNKTKECLQKYLYCMLMINMQKYNSQNKKLEHKQNLNNYSLVGYVLYAHSQFLLLTQQRWQKTLWNIVIICIEYLYN